MTERNLWDPDVQGMVCDLAWKIIPIFDCCNPHIQDHAKILLALLDFSEEDVLVKVREAKGTIHSEEALEWVLNQMQNIS